MMAGPQKLCLNWKNFQTNISTAFRDLRSDNDFADVTLACEDGQLFSAHKVILASSSPFFMGILKKYKNPQPLIFLKGMRSEDLSAILDFFYFGEANVHQENLDTFLLLADEFQLKGLRGNQTEMEAETFQEPPTQSPNRSRTLDKHRETTVWKRVSNFKMDKIRQKVKRCLPSTVSLMQLRLSHGKSQSIWQKPTTWQKSECLGFVIGWPLPVYSGKTQGGYKK